MRVFLLCLLAGSACAQTYDFTDGVVSGQISFLAPLTNGDNQLATDYGEATGPNGFGTTFNTTSWVFTSPGLPLYPYGYPGIQNTFSSAQSYIDTVDFHNTDGSGINGYFDFTVANNQIVAWNIQLDGGAGIEESNRELDLVNLSSTGGDTWSSLVCDYYCYTLSGSEPSGTFTEVAAAPEINTASLPAALTLLLGGLAVMRRRR
jgi:hypothetical protein